jgi:hypothetical protein
MSDNMYTVLQNAFSSKARVAAIVTVQGDSEPRMRIGTVDRLVHASHRPKADGYVTFALQEGGYRTAQLSQVKSIGYLP